MAKAASTADEAKAMVASTTDEAVANAASAANEAVATAASTVDEPVAKEASTADEAVAEATFTALAYLLSIVSIIDRSRAVNKHWDRRNNNAYFRRVYLRIEDVCLFCCWPLSLQFSEKQKG